MRLYSDVATVQLGDRQVQAVIRGKLFMGNPPAVGDLVRVEKKAGDSWVLVETLLRRSVLERRAAGSSAKRQVLIANVDQVMVVFAAAQPEPLLHMLDRFLVAVEANNLHAHIVVNKIDLVPAERVRAMFAPYAKAGYPVHCTSARMGLGLQELRAVLEGKESVFIGPSGVGKSSLLNALYPGLNLRVGQVSAAYGKGRHITVGGQLIRLPQDTLVADTAGLREIGLWMVPPGELPDCFPEFRPYMEACRFSDCAHIAEPGCAILKAVERGEISPSRYQSYVRLRGEAIQSWPRW